MIWSLVGKDLRNPRGDGGLGSGIRDALTEVVGKVAERDALILLHGLTRYEVPRGLEGKEPGVRLPPVAAEPRVLLAHPRPAARIFLRGAAPAAAIGSGSPLAPLLDRLLRGVVVFASLNSLLLEVVVEGLGRPNP